MLLFLILVLIFSSLGMFLLLYAKNWELTTGRTLLPGIRPHIAASASRLLGTVEYHLPRTLKRAVRNVGLWLRWHVRDLVARILLAFERTLESTLEHLKHSLSPARTATGAASSAFLREVGEHKRRLTRVTRVRKAPLSGDVTSTEIR